MNVHRPLSLIVLLAFLAGCMSPAVNTEPAQDRLSDHTRCDYRKPASPPFDVECNRAARPLEVVTTLPDAVWLCTWYEKTGGRNSTDPYIFSVFYDPQANRHAIWFNLTYEGRLEPPGVWHMAFYMDHATFYSFANEGPTGFVVLPEMLPDGPYDFRLIRLNVTLGGSLAGGTHRVLWFREPVNDPNTDRSTTGAIHAVRANGTDYFFHYQTPGLSIGDGLWQGQDYSLNVWWSTHSIGSDRFYPNPPSDRFGGAVTPYTDATFCKDRPPVGPTDAVPPWGRST